MSSRTKWPLHPLADELVECIQRNKAGQMGLSTRRIARLIAKVRRIGDAATYCRVTKDFLRVAYGFEKDHRQIAQDVRTLTERLVGQFLEKEGRLGSAGTVTETKGATYRSFEGRQQLLTAPTHDAKGDEGSIPLRNLLSQGRLTP